LRSEELNELSEGIDELMQKKLENRVVKNDSKDVKKRNDDENVKKKNNNESVKKKRDSEQSQQKK
jgi:hypothetical protein